MSLKVSRCLPSFLLVLFATHLPVNAQSVPCSAITRNPLVLEALLDSYSKDSDSDLQDDTINAAQLERLQFSSIVIQPGDALYMEYKGRDFSIDADFASGERTAFDSSPKGNYEEWRKGVLPLDMFRGTLNQRLVRLWATAKNPNQVLFRNIKIIRAGRPVFEFAKLISYGKPQVKTAVERQLPCIGLDDVPANGASTTVSYSPLNPAPVRNFSGGLAQPMFPPFPMLMQSTTTNPDPNHYKFTGKELDDETGLYNYGARYYSPGLGRYITPDWSASPAAIPYANLGNPQSLNLYSYTKNNPITFGDLDGHCPDGICYDITKMSPAQVDQLAKNTTQAWIGAGKALVNAATSTANITLNVATHGGTYIPGSTPEIPQLQPSNQAQAAGMVTFDTGMIGTGLVSGGVAIVDITSTVRAASVIESASAESTVSKVDRIVNMIDEGGFNVTANTKTATQEANVTITNASEPGVKLNLRTETHPLPESGGQPVRHVNVERVEPGPKNRPEVVSNKHIDH